MASSNSPASQRRRPLRKRQPLSRSNSSFLGTIKSLVTAPLAWFASTDDFEDSKDLQGKRRRLVAAPTEPTVDHDDRSTRTKRIRVHSPLRDEPHLQLPPSDAHGYLDPPGSVFQHQYRNSSPLIHPSSARSLSVTQPYDFSINNSNLIHANTLSRTMSIDPPARPLSSTPTKASTLNHDTSLGSSTFIKATRDLSMPPLSTRTPFLMRSSMTPQPPPHREVSEPPSLNTLVSNPTFVRAPVIKAPEFMHEGLPRQPSVTLGSLVDSVRNTRSPVRQHSSLLYGSSTAEQASQSTHSGTTIEKALHELDIYKTPLIPTRLRSSNIPTSSSSSDLFKSRRASHLVLMQDDKRINRLGRKVSGKKECPHVNETKPYAGEGGMKKLLARRKQEAEDENEKEGAFETTQKEIDEDRMDDGFRISTIGTSTTPPPLPPSVKVDWLSTNTSLSTSTSTSSLRVGRTKTTRSHFTRPARPTRTKFSAAYADDDAMDDTDELDTKKSERKKERQALEEVTKHGQVYQIPEGFTFANLKETVPVGGDITDAKELPRTSLPFSLMQQSQLPQELHAPSFSNTELSNASHAVPISVPLEPTSVVAVPPPNISVPVNTTAAVGIPNFFTNSSALSKPLDLPKPAPLIFSSTRAISPSSNSISPLVPVKDMDNPLWEGENKRAAESALNSSSLFSGLTRPTSRTTSTISSQSSAAHGISAFSANLTPTPSFPVFEGTENQEAAPALSQPPLFGGQTTTASLFSLTKPLNSSATTLFPKDISTVPSPPGTALSTAPGLSFSVDAPDIPGLSGETTKPAFPATEPASDNTVSKELSLADGSKSTSFLFSQSSSSQSSTSAPLFTTTIAAPKPQFGFLFGNMDTSKGAEEKPAIRPFPSMSSAPPIAIADSKESSTPFLFGGPVPSTLAPTTIGFTSSGGGSNASDVSSKPFTFGQPTTLPPTARPSTPPRSLEQEVSMEESPTRDIQPLSKPIDRPMLGGGGFDFPTSTTFGTQSNAAPVFSFGPSSSHNNFGKSAENEAFGGGNSFGQTASTGFPFGQTKDNDQGTSSSGPFSFAPTSVPTAGPTSIFPFGGPGNTSAGAVFGQSQSGSAPGSPSTFNQASPFSFVASLPAANTVFSFGSQPASPAGGTSLNLAPPGTSSGFGSNGGSGFGQTQPSLPFGATPTTAPTGGSLFTIGAPPAPSPGGGSGGLRQIRKLPNRSLRGGKR